MPATAPEPKPLTREQLIDQYVEDRAYARSRKPDVDPILKRYQETHALLLTFCEGKPAGEAIVLEGHKYKVPISAQENQSTINLPGAVKKLGGLKWLLINCKVTLKAVRSAMDEKTAERFITTERTGPREIGEPSLK
jgi:hypothetical protein